MCAKKAPKKEPKNSAAKGGKKYAAIWINANLATMTGPDYGRKENAALAVDADGKICWTGKMRSLRGKPEDLAEKVHDVKGKWITPGLVDCHTHLVYGGNRAKEFELRLKGASYEEIARAGGGILSTVNATREATPQQLQSAAQKRLNPLMNEGVTAIEIKSGYGLDTATEAKMLRVARKLGDKNNITVKTTFLGAHAIPPEYNNRADDYISYVCVDMLPKIAKEELADAVDAFGENIAFTPEQVERVFKTAKKYKLPVKLHADQLSDQTGAAVAAKYKALSADHLEYTTEKGARAMGKSGTVAVLLPGAFYFLRETQKPPVDLFRKHGVPIALATDSNPGSSPATSLLLMMNMACTFFRMTPEEALLGVTAHAARALGLESECGRLSKGMRGDFAIWDIDGPEELAYRIGHNPLHQVVYNGKPRKAA